jgi:hypothetical protein
MSRSFPSGFEWGSATASVDRTTFVRTPKPSATRYTQIIRANSL